MGIISRKNARNGVWVTAWKAFIVGIGWFLISPASAVYCSNCATFYQQMSQYAESVNTTLNTAKQLQTQIQQYENMLNQGLSFKDRIYYNGLASDLQNLADLYNNTESLGRNASNIESQFKQEFPGYDDYLNSSGKSAEMQPDRYDTWSKQGLDNARTAMKSAGMNTSTFTREDAQLDQMVRRSHTASGRMQAIQAGNEISAMIVQQLQMLRDLVATQITLQSNYMAQEQARRSADDALRTQRRRGVIINSGAAKGY